jgi:recombinational DNA repair ATPase RecF
MSELDLLRRRKLVEEIDGKIQTFLTGTDRIVGVDKLQANYYFVTAGSICQI